MIRACSWSRTRAGRTRAKGRHWRVENVHLNAFAVSVPSVVHLVPKGTRVSITQVNITHQFPCTTAHLYCCAQTAWIRLGRFDLLRLPQHFETFSPLSRRTAGANGCCHCEPCRAHPFYVHLSQEHHCTFPAASLWAHRKVVMRIVGKGRVESTIDLDGATYCRHCCVSVLRYPTPRRLSSSYTGKLSWLARYARILG